MPSPTSPRAPDSPVRYGSRDGSAAADQADRSTCPGCAGRLPSARARFCSAACKPRAYRERHSSQATPETASLRSRHTAAGGVLVTAAGRPVAHTLYECPRCGERLLGERRCPDGNRFCRRLGLGGRCPHCDEPLLVAELLGEEVLP